MSDLSAQQGASRGVSRESDTGLERSTETKSAYKTTEFIIYLVAAALILIAGFVVDGFNATETWRFFTFLTIGYMISRGLAKAGSRDPYRADR
jgi:F0F1-type ATP synthase assembly protein I